MMSLDKVFDFGTKGLRFGFPALSFHCCSLHYYIWLFRQVQWVAQNSQSVPIRVTPVCLPVDSVLLKKKVFKPYNAHPNSQINWCSSTECSGVGEQTKIASKQAENLWLKFVASTASGYVKNFMQSCICKCSWWGKCQYCFWKHWWTLSGQLILEACSRHDTVDLRHNLENPLGLLRSFICFCLVDLLYEGAHISALQGAPHWKY